MTIKRKLTLICMLLATIPVILASVLLEITSTNQVNAALEESAKRKLTAIRDAKKAHIESYIATIRKQVLNFSEDLMIVDAMQQFKVTFNELAHIPRNDSDLRQRISEYYVNDFEQEYRRQNNSLGYDSNMVLNQLDSTSLALQFLYIKDNPNPLGSKHMLEDARDGSKYSQVHKKYHSHIRDFLEQFGYYDIFLVDHQTGDIVYSVFKEIDYTTSLMDGPYANTGIGRVFQEVRQASNPHTIAFSDFEAYSPSYEGGASFIASPIFDDVGIQQGVLIFQMPVDVIASVMTSNNKWKEVGLGQSGESYLVGSDLTMRSPSRFLLEEKSNFIQGLYDVGADEETLQLISAKDSTIGLLKIDNDSVKAALRGETGFQIITGYRGTQALSAYTPLETYGVRWALISEIDADEAFAAKNEITTSLLIVSVQIVVVVLIISVAVSIMLASSLTKPIVRFKEVMTHVEKSNDLSLRNNHQENDEIGKMSSAFNKMLDKFAHLIKEVNDASQQLADSSAQVHNVALESSDSVKKQFSETEQITKAMNEMAETVQEVAKNSTEAARTSALVDTQVVNGKEVVDNTRSTIQGLADDVDDAAQVTHDLERHCEGIGTVLDVIRSIAEQTNLLALNAAIEAARAGEQGRGFAVVADEVRTLAGRTQESTTEIQEMIEKLQSGSKTAVYTMEEGRKRAKNGVDQVNSAAALLDEIAQAVSVMSDMNTRIASAAEEQSCVANEMNNNINTIFQTAERTAQGAEQTSASSQDLTKLAVNLQEMISKFRT